MSFFISTICRMHMSVSFNLYYKNVKNNFIDVLDLYSVKSEVLMQVSMRLLSSNMWSHVVWERVTEFMDECW
jgi:hypothetical protein